MGRIYLRSRLALLAIVLACAPACAASLQRTTAVALEEISIKTVELRDKVEAQKQAGQMSEQDYRAWKNRLGKVATSGRILTESLMKADGAEASRQVDLMLEALQELANEQVVNMSSTQQSTFNIIMVAIRSALLIISSVVEARGFTIPLTAATAVA
jgi:hypothetical protein